MCKYKPKINAVFKNDAPHEIKSVLKTNQDMLH